jgi:MBOAT, membrane-bound O-acyltransferase family
MGLMHLKIWYAAWRTIILRSAFGAAGTGATIYGSYGTFPQGIFLHSGCLQLDPSYIYVPVGGTRRAVLSTLLVFTFVALWHDLSLRLLTWGWLVSLFIIPELTARWFFTHEKVSQQCLYNDTIFHRREMATN